MGTEVKELTTPAAAGEWGLDMKLHLKVRTYPDAPQCSLWIIQSSGVETVTRQSWLHGHATLEQAQEIGAALGLRVEVEESEIEGLLKETA